MRSKEKAPAPSVLEKLLGGKKEPEKSSKKKVKHKKSVVESHYDSEGNSKGYTVRHSPDSPDEVSYTAGDLEGVKKGFDEHLGEAKPVIPSLAPSDGEK